MTGGGWGSMGWWGCWENPLRTWQQTCSQAMLDPRLPLAVCLLVLVFQIRQCSESTCLESSECKAVAWKSTTGNDSNLFYGRDLGSEVTRCRVTIAPRYLRALWPVGVWGRTEPKC